ncbi:uncharacterized protein J3D65DRAFT_636144 [Phyllosticta citribraziliensis]|uniref:C3H1-type domain-containing protein n=1 Tax=Phyllosticta citribraziliensis TaxID=989973 RepID=A0ABR1LAE6_9PEZI
MTRSEDITVYSFQGSRPSYALVEAENEQEAGRIAIWIDRECLFGWPISARVVRTMTKDQVSTVLRGEAVDNSGTVESLTEGHAPSWATTTPQLTTIPCRYWEQGYCRNGPSCTFSHRGPSRMPARFNHHQHTEGLQTSINLDCYPDEEDLLGTRIYRGRFRDDR